MSEKQRSLISWEEFPDQIQSVLKELLPSDNAIDSWFGGRILTTGFDDGDLFRIN